MPADLTEARAALAAEDAPECGASFPHRFLDGDGCCVEAVTRVCCRAAGHAGDHSEFRGGKPLSLTAAIGHLRAALAEVDRLTAQLGKLTPEHKPRIDCLPNGELDDVVLCGVVHIERMSDTHIWLGVDTAEDYVSFNIATTREPLVWQQQDGDLEPGVSARAAEVDRLTAELTAALAACDDLRALREPAEVEARHRIEEEAARAEGRQEGLREAARAFPSEGLVPGVPVVLFADAIRARILALADGEVKRG